ncbi:predicted protein [Botrytis cinerea T4]|uniref:Uncharacterized protein n=1 Tax=Botryotinia fuckeliana (strain T4) TaxID=999810 RepID=G2Y387_BOTF4|nr:predicted protein [Botrytis cinerea T4]
MKNKGWLQIIGNLLKWGLRISKSKHDENKDTSLRTPLHAKNFSDASDIGILAPCKNTGL